MNISDEVLAMCELSNDLLFHKIPEGKHSHYVEGSLAAGISAAQHYKGQNIRELCKSNGIEIEYSDETNGYCGLEFRAQVTMSEKKKLVKLYRKSINELAKVSGNSEEVISCETAIDIHLCHEFYHYLEYIAKESIVERLEPVVTIKLGPISRKARINRCCEVAAHAFAKEIMGLKYLPNIYDYMYLINSGKMKETAFEEMLQRYGDILKN